MTADDKKTLQEYLHDLPDGTKVSWLEIEAATGVAVATRSPARQRCRHTVRSTLHGLGRAYLATPGFGIELSSPGNAIEVVQHHAERVQAELTRAQTATTNVIDRHRDELSAGDRKRLTAHGAALATIRLSVTVKG